MKRLILPLALAVATGGFAIALAQPAGNVAHGKQIFATYGCYQCHGYQGQGAAAGGPKLAPNPLPIDAFTAQLRHPRDRMPIYTQVTVSDSDVADLYAYLQTIPKAKTVADIPLLNQ